MGEDTAIGARWYGSPPYELAVVHGGPGAPGSAAGAARALSSRMGVVEPLQSAGSLDGQVDELAAQLRHADVPLGVLGHSWGAMLGYLVAARHPELVRVLVMVGAMLTAEAEDETRRSRLARLSEPEQAELEQLRGRLDDPAVARRYDELVQQADAVAPVAVEHDWLAFQPEVKRAVWAEAVALRDDGRLVAEGRGIRCPVVVVHGARDPHPLAGAVDPLREVIQDLEVVVLTRCGHMPWKERHAREAFVDHVVRACTRPARCSSASRQPRGGQLRAVRQTHASFESSTGVG